MSSNADTVSVVSDTTFKVGTRQLSEDLSSAGAEHNARDLGAVPATRFLEILQSLAGLPLDQVVEADPHLVVTARRGRFLVRPSRGKLRLFDATDAARAHLELEVAEVPRYLEGVDVIAPAAANEASLETEAPTSKSRMALAMGLMTLSLLSVAGSAYYTFQPIPLDAEISYTRVSAPVQVAALRGQFSGEFSTGKGIGSRTLILRPEGTLVLTQMGADNAISDKREDTYQVALRDGQTPVARTTTLGPIELRDAKTLFYAGEPYTRHP